MPQFNPDVKDINPVNPIGWSKSAEVPAQFASALSEGIKGIGNFIGQAAEAGDKLVKQSAQQAAENIFRPEVDDEAARLAGVDFSMKLNANTVAASDSTNGLQANATVSGLKEGDINMPPALQQLPKTLGVLDGARANGHLSETAYYGRLMSLAKDLRSQYPVGYREYIDAQISKVTGVDPANAYMKSIIGDINTSMGNALAEKNKVLGRILEHQGLDPIGLPKMYEALSAGRVSIRQAMDYLAPLEAEKINHERRMMKVAEKDAGSKEQEYDAEQTFRTFGAGRVTTSLDGMVKLDGLTSDRIRQIQSDWFAGKINLTGEQMESLKNRQIGYMNADRDAMVAELNKVQPDPDKPNYRPIPLAAILKDKGAKIMEDTLAPHRDVLKGFVDKDLGMALSSERVVKALKDDYAKLYWKDPEYQKVFGQLHTLKDSGGDNAVAQAWSRVINKGLPTTESVALLTKIANLSTAPDPRGPDFKEVNNLGEAIRKTAKEEAKTGIKQIHTWQELQNQIDGPKGSLLAADTKPEVAEAIADNYFSPENKGVLRLIKPDYKDEKGNVIPGQESWFARFTRPEVVQKIKTMSAETQANYRDWVQSTYEDIAKQHINNLKVMNIEGTYKIGWNSATGQFTVKSLYTRPDDFDRNVAGSGEGSRLPNVRAILRRDPVQETVTSLNKAISGLSNSYIHGGNLSQEDVQAKVLETLQFDKQRFGKMEGLPAKFLQSMELEYQKNEEERKAKLAKEADQKKKSTP